MIGPRPQCSWCGSPAAPGLTDEDGDPSCLRCARAADLAAGRSRLVEVALVPVADTASRRCPTWVSEVSAILRLRPSATEIAHGTFMARARAAGEAWLRARGWGTVPGRGGARWCLRRASSNGLSNGSSNGSHDARGLTPETSVTFLRALTLAYASTTKARKTSKRTAGCRRRSQT
jgi:hypothetical protein